MIRKFWVENFYSIKDRQTLNFEAKNNSDSFASVMVDDRVRLNKIAILYGANAVRYDYEISYNEDYILSETLIFYPKGYKALFYSREFVSESSAANISFGTSAEIRKKAENIFVSNTLNNHTVLSTYAKVAFDDDVKSVSELFAWITGSMFTGTTSISLTSRRTTCTTTFSCST